MALMPNPRRSMQYPQEMWDLVWAVGVDGFEKEVDFDNAARARGVRTKFYTFFNALRRDSEKPQPWMEPGDFTKVKEYCRASMSVQLAVRDNTLVIRPRDKDPTMVMLADARTVQSGKASMPDDKMAESLAKLAGKLGEKK